MAQSGEGLPPFFDPQAQVQVAIFRRRILDRSRGSGTNVGYGKFNHSPNGVIDELHVECDLEKMDKAFSGQA
jgi:hypothetical protein